MLRRHLDTRVGVNVRVESRGSDASSIDVILDDDALAAGRRSRTVRVPGLGEGHVDALAACTDGCRALIVGAVDVEVRVDIYVAVAFVEFVGLCAGLVWLHAGIVHRYDAVGTLTSLERCLGGHCQDAWGGQEGKKHGTECELHFGKTSGSLVCVELVGLVGLNGFLIFGCGRCSKMELSSLC